MYTQYAPLKKTSLTYISLIWREIALFHNPRYTKKARNSKFKFPFRNRIQLCTRENITFFFNLLEAQAGGDTFPVAVERVLSSQLANAIGLRDTFCRMCASIIFITKRQTVKILGRQALQSDRSVFSGSMNAYHVRFVTKRLTR